MSKVLVDIKNIDVVDIKPSECIVIKCDEDIDIETAHHIFKHMEDKYPENSVVMVPWGANLEFVSKDVLKQIIDNLNSVYHAMPEDDCECCGFKIYYDKVAHLHNCNTCARLEECEFRPAWGEDTRFNCYWYKEYKNEGNN